MAGAESAAEGVSVGVIAERTEGERRVALVPGMVERLARRGMGVVVAPGAGTAAYISDDAYTDAGATIGDPWQCDVVVGVNPPAESDIDRLREGTVVIGFLDPFSGRERLERLERAGGIGFAMESVPRISRAQSMDALSSQANVAGYRAVLAAAQHLPRFFPMLTTAAGTVKPAKALVLGAGVAGLQALATAKRLGAQTTGYDVRPEVADQVRSVGAQWLDLGIEAVGEGGYARELTEQEQAEQQRRLTEAITGFDVVITTAAVPGRRAPVLVPAEAVRGMPAGGVIVDLAGGTGGNCELTQPGEVVTAHGVTICAPLNPAAEMPAHASELYARNVVELLELIVTADGTLALDRSDQIIADSCVAGRDRLDRPPEPGADDSGGSGGAGSADSAGASGTEQQEVR
ncbi:NAD(P) transhydrogenase subunit alpha [Haloechinothrix sp. LS1_15]|uniref:NAD(P) transhydrogenase subunit alpha n=1 Tax=Haloechinothrix sp. LS1_15 TaxID=2652248 RepID=UPI002948A31A|nr:NAD(P) transhydrogenase subunit alpha [Haloechinothrix sp. LS1_15]MDV6012763.1 NAD(P) transhydrogenase subunit alpha [Haloechinothrix sp. LS1_15]